MEGYDLRAVLDKRVDLQDLLMAKLAKLNLECEPFLSVKDFLAEKSYIH